MPFNFFQLPIVAVFGLIMFGEMPDAGTWAGAAVIFSSSYYIARRESRIARRADAV
jgi:drug/metabolite transporter (DMT)-like permease